MTTPSVSVIIPTFEDDEYLRGAIASVREQTFEDWEIVIIDSSGVDWIAELAADNSDVVYETQPPRGPAAARNRGIEMASGEYIAFLDADDRWHEQKLEMQVPRLEAGADIVYSDQEVIDS